MPDSPTVLPIPERLVLTVSMRWTTIGLKSENKNLLAFGFSVSSEAQATRLKQLRRAYGLIAPPTASLLTVRYVAADLASGSSQEITSEPRRITR